MTCCSSCGRSTGMDDPAWRCTCGGVLELEPPPPFSRDSIVTSEPGFWRYAAALPPLAPRERLRLGEVVTPLVEAQLHGFSVLLKLDYMLPSASYKDRGAAVLMSVLRKQGVTRVFDDSSGNAGAAAAAYAAAAGIDCTILVPAQNSPGKLAQISAYGAHLVAIEGSRAAVAEAAMKRANTSFYASHVWHPVYPAGVATLGFEIWEQLGYRAPSAIFVPAGQGSLVLGLARAYEALSRGGQIDTLPAIFAVQSRAFPALARSFEVVEKNADGTDELFETVAEGIACREPLREHVVVDALRKSSGRAIVVSDREITDALTTLVRSGFYVEPTGAVAAAGLGRARLNKSAGPVVVVLTGSGLKANKQIADMTKPHGIRDSEWL
jgi:threonine synthase